MAADKVVENCDTPKYYVVRFEGNNSKKSDGKESWVEANVELYDQGQQKCNTIVVTQL